MRDALGLLREFKRKARILAGSSSQSTKALFAEIDEKAVLQESQDVYQAFLKNSRTVLLDATKTNPEEVLSKYFQRKAPFGEGKKKNEFPDAFSVAALEAHATEQERKIYVVSEDPDLVRVCEKHEKLIAIATLEKLLDILNGHDTTVTEKLKQFVNNEEEILRKMLERHLESAGAYNEASWEDSEVELIGLVVYSIGEVSVVRVLEQSAVLSVDVDVDVEATVTGPAWNSGYYDNELGKMVAHESISKEHAESRSITVEIELEFEYRGGKLVSCSVTGLSSMEGIVGIPVQVEE